MKEFVIPGSLDEMSSSSMGSYMMLQPWDERKIARAQEEFQSKAIVLDDAPQLVPIFYSAITNVADLSEFMLTDLWRLMFKFVNKLDTALHRLASGNSLGPEERKCLRNETTIITYFFGQYIQAVDLETRKGGAAFDAMAKKTKKKGPVGVGRFANWDTERITALEALLQILEAPLKSIFNDDAMNQLANSIASNIYRLLGNASCCKDATCSDICGQIITILIVRYGHGSLCPYQIPALMSTTEHVVPVLASVFDEVVNKHGEISLLPDLLRELTAITDSATGDSLVSKNTGELLCQLCKRLAERILPLVAYIDALLNAANFTVRNSALSAMTELVKNGLTKPELTEKQEKVKASILEMLVAHTNDVSSHVRSRSIKLLIELLLANSLPLGKQPEIITAVAKRLRDATATVRKSAVQYLIEYIDYNTYLSSMSPENLEGLLEQKRAAVAELKEQIGVDRKTTDDWDEVSAKMMPYFRKHELPAFRDDESNLGRPTGTLQEELGNVTLLLDEGKFKEAIRLLQRCVHWFQECPLFQEVENKDSKRKKEAGDGEESEDDEDEDSEEDEEDEEEENDDDDSEKVVKKSKKNKMDWFNLARNVYLREPPRKEMKNQKVDEHDELDTSQEPDEQETQTDREILVSKLAKHENDLRVLSYLKHYFDVYTAAVQHIGLMLQSKTPSDILSAIEFFVRIINANVAVGCRSISQMAHLHDHKDESVKKAVETAFENLYLTCDSSDARKNTVVVARKLISLFINCSQGELEKWGRVIAELVANKKIPSEVVLVFFEIVTQKLGPEEPLHRITALLLIVKCSTKKASIIKNNMQILADLMKEAMFLKYCVQALSNLELECRWEIDNEIYSTISNVLKENLSNLEWAGWSSAFFESTAFIFKTCVHPVKMLSNLSNSILQAWTDREDSVQFARILSMVQSIAARLYVFLDIDFYGKLQEGKSNKKKNKEQRNKSLSESRRNASLNTTVDADQTGLVGAVADETDAEFIVTLLENEALNENHFLGSFIPHLVNVLKNPKDFPCSKLQQQATVSLISLMLLSSRIYEEQIAFIFTILERSTDELQRCCIVTYIPDLCKSFPNSFDPWTVKVYEILKREKSFNVRKKCILILSDLIMHDQIKVKGTISDVACSLLDEDAAIVRMTEILFQQLATKNNSLYNILPDIISRLSDEEHGVSQKKFHKIASFLFKQLGKDKKLENFVEKLCGRFRSSTTDLQCRNLAFCLKQIPYTERSLRKLIDNVSCYADKLIDEEISACFDDICSQTSRGAKNELKLVVTELQNLLDETRNKSDENKDVNSDDTSTRRTTIASQRSTISSQKSAAKARMTPKTPRTKKNMAKLMDSDSDSEAEFVPASARTRRSKRNASGTTTPTSVRTSKRTRV